MNKFLIILISFVILVDLKAQNNSNLFIGTYTKGVSDGFYWYTFNTKTGQSRFITKVVCSNPSFLAISKDNRLLYVVEEELASPQLGGYKVDLSKENITLITKQPTQGAHPCYVSIDTSNQLVFVGNYTGGNLSVFKIDQNGKFNEAIQVIQHEGSSANKARQESAHIHGTFLSLDQQYLLVTDLGTDKIMTYKVDKNNKLPLTKHDSLIVEAGGGPRHLAFHPNGKMVYAVLELTAEVAVFNFKDGKLTAAQKISMLPSGFKGKFSGADIHLSKDGKFLYATNRGDANTILTYKIDQNNGLLKLIDIQATLGITPRNFTIDPTGKFLLVANQESNEIVVFKRNQKTGILKKTSTKISIGHPVCLVFSNP